MAGDSRLMAGKRKYPVKWVVRNEVEIIHIKQERNSESKPFTFLLQCHEASVITDI